MYFRQLQNILYILDIFNILNLKITNIFRYVNLFQIYLGTQNISVQVRFGYQGRSWAKPNETLALGPQKFWKKLHRKKASKIFFRPPNLPKKFFS